MILDRLELPHFIQGSIQGHTDKLENLKVSRDWNAMTEPCLPLIKHFLREKISIRGVVPIVSL